MDYSKLLKEYSDYRKIPYERLLQTKEWISKREEILTRDDFTCTNCSMIDSEWVENYNISYDIKSPVRKESVIGSFSLLEFQKRMSIQSISIYTHKTKRKGNYYFGISDNRVLFGVLPVDVIKTINKNDLKVFIVNDQNGIIHPVIDYSDMYGLTEGMLLPVSRSESTHMHVHHTRYIKGKNPWEYENIDLITLCNWCHWELHKNEEISIYDFNSSGELVRLQYNVCLRCNGAGVFPEFGHVENGICFRCRGAKFEELI